jgi:hypothetical protein
MHLDGGSRAQRDVREIRDALQRLRRGILGDALLKCRQAVAVLKELIALQESLTMRVNMCHTPQIGPRFPARPHVHTEPHFSRHTTIVRLTQELQVLFHRTAPGILDRQKDGMPLSEAGPRIDDPLMKLENEVRNLLLEEQCRFVGEASFLQEVQVR